MPSPSNCLCGPLPQLPTTRAPHLSQAYASLGRHGEAVEVIGKAARIALKSRGIQHPLTVNVLRIQALIDRARPLTERPVEFNAIPQEMGPAWETHAVMKA